MKIFVLSDEKGTNWPLTLAMFTAFLFFAIGAVIVAASIAIPILVVLGVVKAVHWYMTRPEKTTDILYAVDEARVRADFPDPHDYFDAFATRYENDCATSGNTPAGYNVRFKIFEAVAKLYSAEELHETPSPLRKVVEGSVQDGEYRDLLMEKAKKVENPARTIDVFTRILTHSVVGFTSCLPELATRKFDTGDGGESGITVYLSDVLGDNTKQAVEYLIAPIWKEEARNLHLFEALRMQLDKNMREIDDEGDTMPTDFKGTDEECIIAYLKYTELIELFTARVPWAIPEQLRFEHQWIVAPQGAGKTQLIQYQLTGDLERVTRGEASVVVMDSQGDLISLVSSLKAISPDQLVIIEPDPGFPLALNPFDLGKDRLEGYDERTRDMLDNSAIELLTYVFDTLLGTATTPKQTALFRHSIRLCRIIPEATIHTLYEILSMNHVPFPEYVERLPSISKKFFHELFVDPKQFAQTKQELAWRLSLMLENSTFERMFAQKRSKIDLFKELNSAKVILINTDKSLLKEKGTELFGRFFIAMLLQASQERAAIERSKRLPTYVYIDECQDYIAHDSNVTTMLDQARKMNVGMVLAHQRTAQVEKEVLDALTNVSVKCARAVNDSGSHVLARNMATTPEFISKQAVGSFAIALRNQPAVSIKIPPFVMENMERVDEADMAALKARMREKYAVQHVAKVQTTIQDEVKDEPPKKPRATVKDGKLVPIEVVAKPKSKAPPPPPEPTQTPQPDSERPTKWPMA